MEPRDRLRSAFDRLEAAGLSEDYIKGSVLPEWWDDAIADVRAGYLEGMLIISRKLHIGLKALLDDKAEIVFVKDVNNAKT